ncbi:MAG: hypothetical protein DRP49_08805, partial [Spirochaetes bacterium]
VIPGERETTVIAADPRVISLSKLSFRVIAALREPASSLPRANAGRTMIKVVKRKTMSKKEKDFLNKIMNTPRVHARVPQRNGFETGGMI